MTSADRVAVVGTGLIGTSVAMAAERVGDAVRGFDTDADALARAAERSGLTPSGTLEECVAGATVVVVSTPIPAVPGAVAEALRSAPDAVVTDVASVKSHVASELRGVAGAGDLSRYVGGHPMGGSERSGPDHASASVLDGIVWALDEGADARALERVEAFVAKIGARPVRLDAERHDRLVAMVSHLPQVASTALMGVAATEEAGEPELLLLAAAGSATSRGSRRRARTCGATSSSRTATRSVARSPCTWSGSRGSARWSRPATPARSSGRSARRRTRACRLRPSRR